MEKVTGIGGVFFRAKDPKGLQKWYQEHLGIDTPSWQQKAGETVFSTFAHDTKYFGPSNKAWMVNFRVANLDAMIAQLRAANIEVKVDADESYGRFARLYDPEENAIELWQPLP